MHERNYSRHVTNDVLTFIWDDIVVERNLIGRCRTSIFKKLPKQLLRAKRVQKLTTRVNSRRRHGNEANTLAPENATVLTRTH